MAKPATQIIPLVKPCSSTALRSYPSAYPSRLGSVIDNHFNCGGMIFFLWCLALHGVSYSRQSPWYLQAPPLRPAPHTASRSYSEDYICHDDVNNQVLAAARTCVCRDFIFDSIQGEFILLYTKQEIQSFSDEFIYSRMKELLSSPLCRDIPESEQVDCLFCLERYDCANSIPPEFFQLNDEFQRRRYINRRRSVK